VKTPNVHAIRGMAKGDEIVVGPLRVYDQGDGDKWGAMLMVDGQLIGLWFGYVAPEYVPSTLDQYVDAIIEVHPEWSCDRAEATQRRSEVVKALRKVFKHVHAKDTELEATEHAATLWPQRFGKLVETVRAEEQAA
jgi:hypothetical protein